MMYLDTHAVVALYQGELAVFSRGAVDALEQENDLRISPVALLELEYLFEVKRLRVPC